MKEITYIDEKKQRIIEVAENFFSRFGIRKTTMEEIAEKARMGKSTLYYYFKSKEDIFAEVIRKESQILKQKLTEEINKASTPQEKIRAYVLTRMTYLKELSNYYSTLTNEYLKHYSFVEKERKDFTQYEIQTLINILTEGVEEGAFSVEDVNVTAWAIAIAMKGLEYPLIVEDTVDDMEVEINKMIHILLKGIETR